MEDIFDILEKLKNYSEDIQIEAKSCSFSPSKTVYETICAFSNSFGGIIILGVNPDTYEPEGVVNPQQIKDTITSTCNSYFNKKVYVMIEQKQINSYSLLVVRVDESDDKPVYIYDKGLPGGAFIRSNSSNLKCNWDDIIRMKTDDNKNPYEKRSLKNFSFEDIDIECILFYKDQRYQRKKDAPELKLDDKKDFLESLGCIADDGLPNVAAALCFGKEDSIRRAFPNKKVDFIINESREWIDSHNQKYTKLISNQSPLIKQFIELKSILEDNLKTGFKIDGTMKSGNIPVIPMMAIRESVQNILIHRDYKVDSNAHIIQYFDRLEMTNPGYSKKPIYKFSNPGSEFRNPTIARILNNIGIGETTGSGIATMIKAMKESGLDEPIFTSDRENNLFSVTFNYHHLLDSKTVAQISKFKHLSLEDNDVKALAYVLKFGKITNQIYRDINLVDTLNATKGLKKLVSLGLLKQVGDSRKKTEYRPTEQFQ